MTRREQEITEQKEIDRILNTCNYLHLGLIEDGLPYVVTMNYGAQWDESDGHLVLYLHAASAGKKIEIIKENRQCFFTMECNVEPFSGEVACQYGVAYEAISGKGDIRLIDDSDERAHALQVIMHTQTGHDGFCFDERLVSIVSIMRIDVTSLQAKRRPLPAVVAVEKEKQEKP